MLSSRTSTILRRSGATFFKAVIKRGMFPNPSITSASVITEEIKDSIQTPWALEKPRLYVNYSKLRQVYEVPVLLIEFLKFLSKKHMLRLC